MTNALLLESKRFQESLYFTSPFSVPFMRFPLLLSTYLILLISPEPACRPKSMDDSGTIENIRLTEFTRGTNRSIEVTPTQTTVRINDAQETTPTPSKSWQDLTQQLQNLPVSSLAEIPILSKKHQVDAALHATLTVVTSDTTYTSDTFDHNAPPELLRSIVDSLYRRIPATLQDRFQH
ncbi:hypothetical protein [Salmonirosea aquatica]|uniref:Uncharacterized protein n=1 Tax=Salmonirosea aquatica TaxID=2654236 RepID=A0A7C9FXM7_9BACT|nr:hypothetical protein [Cytophagaceae bacterium SJW1-29]